MIRWLLGRDRAWRVDVRTTHRLDIDELAALLAAQCDAETDVPRTRAGIRDAVRQQLANYGTSNLPDAEPTDAHRDAVLVAFPGCPQNTAPDRDGEVRP